MSGTANRWSGDIYMAMAKAYAKLRLFDASKMTEDDLYENFARLQIDNVEGRFHKKRSEARGRVIRKVVELATRVKPPKSKKKTPESRWMRDMQIEFKRYSDTGILLTKRLDEQLRWHDEMDRRVENLHLRVGALSSLRSEMTQLSNDVKQGVNQVQMLGKTVEKLQAEMGELKGLVNKLLTDGKKA